MQATLIPKPIVIDEDTNESVTITKEMELEAYETHSRLVIAGQVAMNSLAEFAVNLKIMMEKKLYYAMGYRSFRSYTQDGLGLTSRQAYSYIKVLSTLGENTLKHGSNLGITKLDVLTQLPEVYRQEIIEEGQYVASAGEVKRIEEISVREMREIKRTLTELEPAKEVLEHANQKLIELQADSAVTPAKIGKMQKAIERLEENVSRLSKENAVLKKEKDEFRLSYKEAQERNKTIQATLDKLRAELNKGQTTLQKLLQEKVELEKKMKEGGNQNLNTQKADLENQIVELQKRKADLEFTIKDLEYEVRDTKNKRDTADDAVKLLNKHLNILPSIKGEIEATLAEVTADPYGSLNRDLKRHIGVLRNLCQLLENTLETIKTNVQSPA